MIIRIIVVDPNPRTEDDLVVYQVPENSRAMKLLCTLLSSHDIEHVIVKSQRKPHATQTKGPSDSKEPFATDVNSNSGGRAIN